MHSFPWGPLDDTTFQRSQSGMNRRKFLATTVAVSAVPLAGRAQSPMKVRRIGFLSASAPVGESDRQLEAFRDGLRQLGYVEGQNIAIEYRWAEGRFERLPGLATELVRLKVDVIVAAVTQASLAAKNATGTIPIVMAAVSDPVGAGLVASLARPGANVTGTSSLSAGVAGKSLELLREVVPQARRMAILWNPANPVFQSRMVKETEVAARSLGVQLQMLAARDPEEIDRAFELMVRERAEALTVIGDPVFILQMTRIANLATKHRLPSASGSRPFADAGCLMTYGPNFRELYRRAAFYTDRILKGTKPMDLPVEQPTKFELVINLNAARTLGLTIPPSLLVRADELIK